MDEETKKAPENQGGQGTNQKAYTQEQVDAMIGERLSREREKYADYDAMKEKAEKFDAAEEASKSELQKAQDSAAALQKQLDDMKAANSARDARDKVAAAKGVPAYLLTGSTEEECTAQADRLLQWRGDPEKYAETKDAGETRTPGVTKADILAIKNEKERLKAIREHIDLFT